MGQVDTSFDMMLGKTQSFMELNITWLGKTSDIKISW